MHAGRGELAVDPHAVALGALRLAEGEALAEPERAVARLTGSARRDVLPLPEAVPAALAVVERPSTRTRRASGDARSTIGNGTRRWLGEPEVGAARHRPDAVVSALATRACHGRSPDRQRRITRPPRRCTIRARAVPLAVAPVTCPDIGDPRPLAHALVVPQAVGLDVDLERERAVRVERDGVPEPGDAAAGGHPHPDLRASAVRRADPDQRQLARGPAAAVGRRAPSIVRRPARQPATPAPSMSLREPVAWRRRYP